MNVDFVIDVCNHRAMRLYHFTNGNFGLQAIGLRRLKISRLDQLNDPFEMMAGTQSDPDSRLAMRLGRELFSKQLGILCLSRDWHNPVLWGHYADRHRGMCLGFDVDDSIAMPVTYVRKRLPADDFMKETMSNSDRRLLAGKLASTKFSHWSYEQEVRCWSKLDPEGPDIQFSSFNKKLQLKEVILGFQSPVTREAVTAALGDLEHEVAIKNTRLAFRTFRVVTQQNRALWK